MTCQHDMQALARFPTTSPPAGTDITTLQGALESIPPTKPPAAPATLTGCDAQCVAKFAQCGGLGYKAISESCCDGLQCVMQDRYTTICAVRDNPLPKCNIRLRTLLLPKLLSPVTLLPSDGEVPSTAL